MKNLLSENMLRFGTKNLTKSTKTKLAEQSETQTTPDPKYLGYAQKIAGLLMTALGGADDENGVLTALKMIPKYGGQPVYDNLLQIVKTSPKIKKQFGYNFNTVTDMIKSGGISSPGYDKSQASPTRNPLTDLGLGITDQEWTRQYAPILQKYNDSEGGFADPAHY